MYVETAIYMQLKLNNDFWKSTIQLTTKAKSRISTVEWLKFDIKTLLIAISSIN